MTTLPSGPPPSGEAHRARHLAESFDTGADRYDRTRLTYPEVMVDALLDKAASWIAETTSFSEPERWQFDWQRHYTSDEWLDQVRASPTTAGFRPQRSPSCRRDREGVRRPWRRVQPGLSASYARSA